MPARFAAVVAEAQDGSVTRTDEQPATRQSNRAEKILVLVGIVVLAFNLRPAAISVGPVLGDITASLGMSTTTAGVLTMLPVLAFAGFGALAPSFARGIGLHRVTLVALACVVVGLAARSQVSNVPVFLLLSLLALSGMATANVLLPSLVKLHFPDRVGLLTSIYTTSLAVGLTMASVLTVPVGEAFGSWRWGLLGWALTALVATLPWVLLVRHDRIPEPTTRTITLGAVARTRLGWAMAVFFGLQSLQAYSIFGWFAQVYRDAGYSASTAGLMLGVVTAMSIPLSFVLPSVAARLTNQTVLVVVLGLLYPVGYIGMLLAPTSGAWLWAVVIGAATAIFPVVLTMIGLRARTSQGTAALSGFAQSVGYLIAAVGPFGMGLLFDLTGGWTVPLIALAALTVPQIITGVIAARPSYVEDHLPGPVGGRS